MGPSFGVPGIYLIEWMFVQVNVENFYEFFDA